MQRPIGVGVLHWLQPESDSPQARAGFLLRAPVGCFLQPLGHEQLGQKRARAGLACEESPEFDLA